MVFEITPSDRMVVRASQELKNHDVVFVGIGLPNLACNLARATHAPDLFMIYESGAVGAIPDRLPVSIGDPSLVTNSLSIVSQADIFQCYLQRGLIEVGFLGGAQIDRFGNLNTTVIGSYASPKVRLPGSGGACEIAIHSKKLLIIMKMSPRSFVETCDFVTSPGTRMNSKIGGRDQGKSRQELGMPGLGPVQVITDLGVLSVEHDELILSEIYPHETVEKVIASCGWPLKVSKDLRVTPNPSDETMVLLRERLQ